MLIAIVTPAYDGRVHDDHARSIDAGRSALIRDGHKVIRLCLTGDAVLPRVRNQCVAEALARGAERIVMVDSDIGFDPPALQRLLSHDVGIVGAAPQAQLRSWRDAANPRCVWRPFPGDAVTDDNGLVEAAGLATGFLAVKAEVFRDLVRHGLAKRYIYPGIAPTAWPHLAAYFDYELAPATMSEDLKRQCREVGVDDEAPLYWEGEDYYFCKRAREIGFASYLDATVGVRHWEGRLKHDFSVPEMMAMTAEQVAAE